MRREQTDISCVFPEAGLGSIQSFPVVSSFGLLHLKVSLPHPTALCLHPELVLIVSCPPLHFAAVPSVVFLHVHRTECVCCWPFSALNLITPHSDDHPSFHFAFVYFLACFNWVPTPPHLVGPGSPARLQSAWCMWQLKWAFAAAGSSTENLSVSVFSKSPCTVLAAHIQLLPLPLLWVRLQGEARPAPLIWGAEDRSLLPLHLPLGQLWGAAQPEPPGHSPEPRRDLQRGDVLQTDDEFYCNLHELFPCSQTGPITLL